MKDREEFFTILTEIDGQDVSAYDRLEGDFDFSRFVLKNHQVVSARPGHGEATLFVVRVPQSIAGFPGYLYSTPVRRTALEDQLTRSFADQLDLLAGYDEAGVSRRHVYVARPNQEILPRSSMVVADDFVEARIYINLPSQNGQVAGDSAKKIFFDELPEAVNAALLYCNLDEAAVEDFVSLMEDADEIRQALPTRGWVGFVGEGSMLARKPGTELPDEDRVETLILEESLLTEVEVPNMESVRGVGIPAGVTVILGDAYSGRVELLRALAAGIYNHVPGDGRELVVTVPDAVHVAADPGRSVRRVDVSVFVNRDDVIPDPKEFIATSADAGMSQVVATVEALEVGAHVLLYDESDSAPSFLATDARLAGLTSPEDRVLAPLSSEVRQMADELGVSIVLGVDALAAEFIPVADTVYRVRKGTLEDVTAEAKALDLPVPVRSGIVEDPAVLVERTRWIVPSSIDPSAGRMDVVIEAHDKNLLQFGRSLVDLSAVTQIADLHQTTTIGVILDYARTRYMDEARPLREILDLVDRDLSTEGLECLTRDLRGDLTRPRRYEIAAALNRLDTMRVAQPLE
jgi:predicted ABC-class ATPase